MDRTTAESSIESVPRTWSPDRDEPFFRLTAREFHPAFAAAATVLLSSYDPADSDVSGGAPRSE